MHEILAKLGLQTLNHGAACGEVMITHGDLLAVDSPVDGGRIAMVREATVDDYHAVVKKAQEVFLCWRGFPAPKRGEIIRQIGLALRAEKKNLGALVSYEMGKIAAEGEGEIQEMIDIADFAVGLSRQLYGLTIASEREQHRMLEQWHPLGVVGIITAFNFPVAVWAWNAFIAAVCGNTMVWKPSRKTPLSAIAVQNLVDTVLRANDFAGVMGLVVGPDHVVGEAMLQDTRLPLISATGSCRMGGHVGEIVARRFGKTLLELGGNNAVIVMDDANLDLALRAVVFGAVGTTGQRCTTTRRLLLHAPIAADFTRRLIRAYQDLPIGDPMLPRTLVGPLVSGDAVEAMQKALVQVKQQGGDIIYGGELLSGPGYEGGCYVRPAIVRATPEMTIVQEETFAPILYVITVPDLLTAIAMQNNVSQGLSSAIFTNSLQQAEIFLSAAGSDCGIANVNLGTSGAEIGGAFGGEKHTGGGRESGSDAWKSYMRRQTQTINASSALPLAQGLTFG